MKIDRLMAIVMELLNKEKVTAMELADRFEVSIRTIQRDIDTINMAGIPIIAYRGQQGGYGIIEEYKIDKSYFTFREHNLLMTALEGVYKAYDDEHLKLIMHKLSTVNGDVQSNKRNLIMDFSPWGDSEKRRARINLIRKAIDDKRVIQFNYIDINGQSTEREVEPLCLILKMNAWYLYCYCHLREDFRLFKLTRIKDIVVQDITYEERQWNEFNFKNSSRELVHLKLRFDPSAINQLDYYFELEDLDYSEDGFIYVDVDYPEDEWVYGMLLSFGDRVSVIEPEHIRDIIKERAIRIVKQYE